jgi:hypothetical protein
MAEVDYRRVMSAAAFAAIPTHEDDPIDGYYEALIDRNERLGHRFFEDAEQLKQLTRGCTFRDFLTKRLNDPQRALCCDSQTRSGGEGLEVLRAA